MATGIINIPLAGQRLARPPGPGTGEEPPAVLSYFVAGPENALVELAVRSVLDHIPGKYNPLVLCGAEGTGKSHLARGVAGFWGKNTPRKSVACVSASEFAVELTEALETHALDEFRSRYRGASLLVFEDADQLAGNLPAQEELIHTMDAIVAAERQLLVTLRADAGRLEQILPSLRSRLGCGLSVDICPPGVAARAAILPQLANFYGVALSKPATRTLAEGLAGIVPELNRVVAQLAADARFGEQPLGPDAARRHLNGHNTPPRPALREIASATARYFSVRLSELRSPSRARAAVTARGVAMYLARHLTKQSLQQIGQYFAGRDHTTVMHGCRRTESLLKTDPAIRLAVHRLQQKWPAT
ncbi:MAG: AAA family ATPase [Pirellulales bacterium]|nr:AAA family ATPase [Pirellulales bacterium]